MTQKRIRVMITGRVQGVGFRASCQRQAVALGLTGWVRNCWNGAVEAVFEGPADSVDRMVTWCRHGPPMAEVEGVSVTEVVDGAPHSSFSIRMY